MKKANFDQKSLLKEKIKNEREYVSDIGVVKVHLPK